MRQNYLLCAQPPVGAEPVNAVQIGGSRSLWGHNVSRQRSGPVSFVRRLPTGRS